MSVDLMGPGLGASLLLAGLLGFRHGLDADHIAVVDGMTRARQLHRSYWHSRLVGLQFAAGHSLAILLASLDGLGMLISTGSLLVIAACNGAHALSPATGAERPLGPIAAALFRITGGGLHPALVGVAFAMSLDSMAQAAFFAARGSDISGIGAVALMAAVFGLGMTLADASNGLLLSWFAQRSDDMARQASRFSSGFIALVALLAAAAGVLRARQEGFNQAWEAGGMWIGVSLMAMMLAVFSLRLLQQRRRPSAASG